MQEFQSFGLFGKHLAKVAAIGEAVTHEAAKAGAQHIANDAKARIGEYQDAVGPYPAWANLAPATVQDRIAKGFTPDDPLLRTGELQESIQVVAEGNTAGAVSDDMVALYQEMGTATIPPRPFLGPAGYDSKKGIERVMVDALMLWIGGARVGEIRFLLKQVSNKRGDAD